MKAKRILAALLAAAALCLLAACGRNTYSAAAVAAANAAQSRVAFDTSPRLDRALRAAVSAGDADAVRTALIEQMGLDVPEVLQQAGQSGIYLYILPGSMDVAPAAASAATQFAALLSGLPAGGSYTGLASMIERGGSYYVVFVVTVVTPGGEIKVPAEIVVGDPETGDSGIHGWNPVEGGNVDATM